MRDMNATLTAYGLKPGSKIMMIGEKPVSPQHSSPNVARTQSNRAANAHHPYPQRPAPQHHEPTPAPPPRSPPQPQLSPEEACTKKLNDIMQNVHTTIVPLIESFSTRATAFIAGTPGTDDDAPTEKKLKFEHSRIGELLLQSLLKIDGVSVPFGHEELRLRRKECVREVNQLLDRADGMKERVLEAASKMASL
ncbi:hypothetical protein BC829DRAFT_182224 [Chytridium lagenaria]|nr:hypothetical protein BC829DRAFT_182224 [Chytridium lagenaria]